MKAWKKMAIGAGIAVLLAIIVGFTVHQSSKNVATVQTGKVQRQDLATVVSASGEIKPKTYVNIGANAYGKITHLYVKEGDHVKQGQLLAQLENVQSAADVTANQASVQAAETDAVAADALIGYVHKQVEAGQVPHDRAVVIERFVDEAGDAKGWIPTVVAERQGELRFGLDAIAVADDSSFEIVRSFKRLLSRSDLSPDHSVRLGSTVLPVADLVAQFLVHVRQALFTRSNLRRKFASDGEICAVVGVPANAYAAQRLLTLEAFRRAGFAVQAMVNEPSAAGFEYTHRHRSTLTTKRDGVVVYDLGGGTFDASLVRMTGLRHEVLATAGVTRLGGRVRGPGREAGRRPGARGV